MAKQKERDTRPEAADMTPMIDMTFMLIAFFMLLINFNKNVNDQAVQVPPSTIAQPDGDIEDEITRLVWNVKQDDDGITEYAYRGKPFRKDQLVAQMESLSAELVASGLVLDKDVLIVIRGDRSAPFGDVFEIVEAGRSRNAKFYNFQFNTQQKID